jgi:endonuclease/exonuclease/phosphatase family metal-dependent hydrolase
MTRGINIRLGTYNIRNTTDRYHERKNGIRDLIASSVLDVCGLQEVRFLSSLGFEDQTVELIDQNVYGICKTTLDDTFLTSDPNFRIDGNCIYYKRDSLMLLSHSHLALSPCRNAQRCCFRLLSDETVTISFTNVHLHHLIGEEAALIRLEQTKATLAWMEENDSTDNVDISFLVGDFNASPSEASYSHILSQMYSSCHKMHFGEEPDFTFPTGLQADTMDTDPPLTCDYLFVKVRSVLEISVVDVELIGNIPDPGDSTLYPSDHIGVISTISLL